MDDRTAQKRPVTVQDVANRAGVSKATAARVLGGYGLTSPSVKQKVLAAAEALDYQANELARSMTTGRSGTIGVIVGDIENAFFGQAVRGISDVARARGFDVILANSGEDLETERAAVRVLLGKRVDGLIVSPAHMHEVQHLRDVQASGRPLVLLDRFAPSLEVDAVVMDDRAAAVAATNVLIEAGHRHISYISATESDDALYRGTHQVHLSTVMERIGGFLEASAAARFKDPERFIRLGVRRSGAALRIVSDLMSLPVRPTAIFASDNVVAYEVFKAARTLGLRIPDDISLIAFHDADWTSVTSPPISVIAQPSYELGQESAKAVIERVSGRLGPPRRIELKTTMIERESVGAPATASAVSPRPRSRRVAG